MKKYKRIELTVEAEQYFPFSVIDVDGFQNKISKVLNKDTMTEMSVVMGGEIRQGGVVVPLEPGDWVLVFPDGTIKIRKDAEFSSDFIEVYSPPKAPKSAPNLTAPRSAKVN